MDYLNDKQSLPQLSDNKEKPSRILADGQDIDRRILNLIRDELYLDFRYLDRAVASLEPRKNDRIRTLATDGLTLYYSHEQLIRLFPDNPVFLNRAYLHVVLHCIFRHLWLRKGRDIRLWNLSCDIAVECLIDSLGKTSVKRIKSGIRTRLYEKIRESGKPAAAPLIYDSILNSISSLSEQEIFDLVREFYVDDHRFWPGDEKASPSAAQASSKWEQIGRRTEQDLSVTGREKSDQADRFIVQIQSGRHRRSYKDFLNRFTVLREELHINPDEFDPGFYSYGLRLYGNLPLIEPLESREVKKIREFVIVIDTSFSTSGDLVRHFLERTFEILQEKDHFFEKSIVHILQCDNKVQDHILITSDRDIRRLLSSFRLVGGGGTDFRPAFRYLLQKIKEGEIRDLQGLIYFTDGKGIFPAAPPPFSTAFVFYDQQAPENLPAWAMKFELTESSYY